VREIYDGLRREGVKHVLIAGDFNDTPDSVPLAPLLANGSDLKDISDHPNFDDGGRPGTYANGTKRNKIDYLLMSPALFAKVERGGVFRKGVWGGKNGSLWEIYPEMTGGPHPFSISAQIAAWSEAACAAEPSRRVGTGLLRPFGLVHRTGALEKILDVERRDSHACPPALCSGPE
jgi:hypothetical protein